MHFFYLPSEHFLLMHAFLAFLVCFWPGVGVEGFLEALAHCPALRCFGPARSSACGSAGLSLGVRRLEGDQVGIVSSIYRQL